MTGGTRTWAFREGELLTLSLFSEALVGGLSEGLGNMGSVTSQDVTELIHRLWAGKVHATCLCGLGKCGRCSFGLQVGCGQVCIG